jgi:hypothetical protein
MRALICALAFYLLSSGAMPAQEVIYGSILSEQSVETPEMSITMRPVGEDVDFLVTLRNKETGFERTHAFEGEGANDPTPFQLAYMRYCDTPVILLTVEYPWRHDLPEFVRVLDTFAFRRSDFAFIDVAFGPLTDIALADDTAYESSDLVILPPIGVRCLPAPSEKPFQFSKRDIK